MAGMQKRIDRAVEEFFSASTPIDLSTTGTVKYTWTESGNGGDSKQPYWQGDVRSVRFQRSLIEGILYRPAIVNHICELISQCLSNVVRRGLMVKGPQGIGKSHSLVNVVRKLSFSGKYLVTFFPNCENWLSASDFLATVCASFGESFVGLGIDAFDPRIETASYIQAFLALVDSSLESRGKQWVFVFDQINKLFVKPENKDAKDASGLAFPFVLVQGVMKMKRITSVISASSNNEMSYEENHENFDEYEHPSSMSAEEIFKAFSVEDTSNDVDMKDGKDDTSGKTRDTTAATTAMHIQNERIAQRESVGGVINGLHVDEIMYMSGGVPLYAKSYIDNPQEFQSEIDSAVYTSIYGLRKMAQFGEWDIILESLISSILGKTADTFMYDKKFLRQESANPSRTRWNYFPLFPAAAIAYRRHLWGDLMDYVEKKEALLLEVCRDADTTNDTRGRLFEIIAIRRCQTLGAQIDLDNQSVNVNPGFEHVGGRKLPKLSPRSKNRNYIPLDPNFPAIDWIWVCGKIVIAVQAHVSNHADVASTFWGMCREAGWFEEFDKVYLVYLSPEDAAVGLIRNQVEPPTFSGPNTRSERNVDEEGRPFHVRRVGFSRSSVSCLMDLAWPDGCSL
eukprot:scaffold10394_cov173-Amphora_coffeaeformis.AAC.5